ncbi:MAG: EAL domain-containing protein, partial [Candidatus Izemoplasmatales bacterium]|nr:EAL domain-containing protein [Candidatus Izemoplasmatales bacterium]
LSDPYQDSITSSNAITFVVTIEENDQVIGYLGIDILVDNLPNAIHAYDYYDNPESKSLAIIVDSATDGRMVLHFSDTEFTGYTLLNADQSLTLDQSYGLDSGMASLLDNLDVSSVQLLNLFGRSVFVVTQVIPGTDWLAAVLIENTQTIGLEFAFVILLVSIGLLMFLVSMVLSKKIDLTLSPVNDILDSIDEIKNGNYNVQVQVAENNELKYVADALNLMSREIGKQVDLVYQTYVYDALTGLKNRKAVHSEIEENVLNTSDKVAVVLLDIDNLKSVNVTKGQTIADEMMRLIAMTLKKTLKNNELIYLNSSNEFVFLVPKVKHLEAVESEIIHLLEQFQEPLVVKNMKVDVKVHFGVSIYPSDGKNMNELMKKCDTALYKARSVPNVKFVFYNDQLMREVNYKAQISEELANAIEHNQLYLLYQPLVDNKSEIYGFEALVRWKSPTLGEVSPQVFIANAEESHLIIPIGTWILREACKTQVLLKEIFNKDFVISVNVSPVQIVQKDFTDVLRRIIRETDIDPKSLVLEITEGVLIESTIYLEETINFLHDIGAKIALDDFGTGYASLTYLRKIPFDNLKIDKSFVDGIFATKKDHSIIGTIVELVHNLDMKVVAEGVETRKQYEYLKQISTDVFQGFLFSKPLAFADLKKYVDQFYKVARTKRLDVFASKDYYE